MIEFLTYDLKVAALIAVFYMFYRLMLARETFHRVNRIVLLTTAVASFVLPLCVITLHETVSMPMPTLAVDADALLTEPVAEAEVPQVPLWQIVLPILFIIGMVATLAYTLWSLFRILKLIKNSEQHPQQDGTTICVTGNADLSPFSWMHYIVMNRSDYEAADPAILAHERGHIRLRHSWDLLLVDTLIALQWFNPAIWMLRQDLRAIHEYEADGEVLSLGINARQYQYLLITKAAGIGGYSLANGISHSTLKNRIHMMLHKKSSSNRLLKLIALIPIVGITLALNAETVTDVVYTNDTAEAPSVETMIADAIKKAETESTEADSKVITFRVVFWPENAHIAGVPVKVIKNGKTILETETDDNGQAAVKAPIGSVVRFTLVDKTKEVKVTKELLNIAAKRTISVAFGEGAEDFENKPVTVKGVVYDSEPTPTPIVGAIVRVVGSTKGVVTNQKGEFSIETSTGEALLFTYVGYEPEQIGVAQLYKDNQDCAVHLKHTSTTKVYDVVEEMPQFPGGVGKMMEYLSVNLRYPKEAEEKGLQGRVIANFVIEPDGSITNAKVVKPLDPALDAEALRLVNGMPKWTPGKQDGVPMRVKYTIPITFRLDNGPAIPALKEQPANQGPEVVAMAHRSETAKSGTQEEQPLVFVDNKEVPFEQLGKIDPKTIDHMDVLKGKSGTEKYGAKGKNGVVLITTKKGK